VSSGLLNARRRTDEPAARRVPHRRLILGAAAVVVLILFAVWLVAFSPVFGVRTVTVRGAQQVTAGQIEAAADIHHGTPLVRLDTGAIQRRVEALRDVGSASVRTSFPSTVVITVTERVPIGYVKQTNGFALVDATGEQYRTVHSAPKDLPRFVVPSGAGARTTGGAVATVAAALPTKIRARISSIQALDPQAITLLLKDDRVVHWGSADRSAEKARVLAALLPRTDQQIDVSDPDQPFTH
jgi:cell division protein FtsQ